jgi:predicted kinase
MSLLQRRADFARKAAEGARSPTVAHEFEELAAVYNGAMEAKHTQPEDAKSDILRHLHLRANQFLTEARGLTSRSDSARADELKYLAGAFGAEASRLKNDAVR